MSFDYEDEFMVADFKCSIPKRQIEQMKLYLKTSGFKKGTLTKNNRVIGWFYVK